LLRQRFALASAVIVSAALIAAILFSSRGLLHLRALAAEQLAINQRIATRLRENQLLRERLHRLRTDDRYLERLAREQLGFVRPGEIVYRFPDRAAPPR